MAEAFAIKFDGSAFDAELDAITATAEECMRPAAQAGIQVFYDEVLLRVPVAQDSHYFYGSSYRATGTRYGIGGGSNRGPIAPYKPGNLRDSIYQAFSKDNSGDGFATYHCSWNYKKAPYGHMVENGTPRAAAHPFIRPAFDAAGDRAVKVVDAFIGLAMAPALKDTP